ncbi:WD40-repeat-containing domain protein [Blastocladiella britannica]|nr:WD40-repeat-containing domain protein [Blastocladiella britannica]
MSARPSKNTTPVVFTVKTDAPGLSIAKKIKAAKATARATSAATAAHRAKLDTARLLNVEDAGFLQAETDLEHTYTLQQRDLRDDHLDLTNRAKSSFSLTLPDFGPYSLDLTRNGRHLLLAGSRGHLATLDWKRGKLITEIHVKEQVRDAVWLHNEDFFATAQRECVYVYDGKTGAEVHALRRAGKGVERLAFLPYHFLLASVGQAGHLMYTDTSTGQVAADHTTRLGGCSVMAQNPWTAVMHLGHSNGTVTMWSPSSGVPLVKMLTHRGPLTAVAVDPKGAFMATGGADGTVKVWDLRNGYKPLHSYTIRGSAAVDLSVSQRGLVSVAHGASVDVWKDMAARDSKPFAPYLKHHLGSSGNVGSGGPATGAPRAHRTRFVPFDDVLLVAHARGVSSMIVPGAGEPNYDALEANPYATRKQRREAEVVALLDKLPADTIALDPTTIGSLAVPVASSKGANVTPAIAARYEELKGRAEDAGNDETGKNGNVDGEDSEKPKNRNPGGRSDRAIRERKQVSGLRRYLNKQTNVIDAKKERVREELARIRAARARRHAGDTTAEEDVVRNPLDRFRATDKRLGLVGPRRAGKVGARA